jgi:hypothetical protein
MSEAMKTVEAFKQSLLEDMLKKITTEQREFFHRLFPDGVSSDKMESAYGLIERTIKKNKNDFTDVP